MGEVGEGWMLCLVKTLLISVSVLDVQHWRKVMTRSTLIHNISVLDVQHWRKVMTRSTLIHNISVLDVQHWRKVMTRSTLIHNIVHVAKGVRWSVKYVLTQLSTSVHSVEPSRAV